MSDCCSPSGYDRLFDEAEARSSLRRYRSKGLDRVARRLVDYLVERGVNGRTLLEVGGGVGAAQVELLKAGATRATNIEISSGYEEVAQELLSAEGLDDRVDRYVMDFAEKSEIVEEADGVLMNRVVCCYPDMPKLMGAALGRSRRFVAASFPRGRWVTRVWVGLENRFNRWRGIDFQAFVHPPEKIFRQATDRDFSVVYEHRSFFWQAVVFERAAA